MMHKKIINFVSAFVISASIQVAFAAERPDATIVMDAYSGKVLQATDADSYRYPASLTKMMTLYLLFDELEAGRLTMNSKLKVSSRGANAEPSRLGLRPGQTITVKDAMYALITKSANDVAITVAENISGSESKFASRMTQKARELGMSRTTFKNASGLPDAAQKTTARDMATLGRMLLIHHGEYYHYFGAKSYSIKGVSYQNHNKLLGKYAGVDGIKTGYIKASGFNLVASAQRNDMRLIGVVIGGETSASRNAMMTKLLDNGFFALTAKRKTWVSPKFRPNSIQVASGSAPITEVKTTEIAAVEPNDDAITALLAKNNNNAIASDSKALNIALPPARPTTIVKLAAVGETTKKPLTLASTQNNTLVADGIDTSAATAYMGQYSVVLNTENSPLIAEKKANQVYNNIKAIIPTGNVKVYPFTNETEQLIYKPMIQGLGSADALTACQLIKNMGEACTIISSHKSLASSDQSS
ncbi:MAG: D-alanyl-D-alanine carboxypeptidase family protein [Alphaproteobacteria bacterium]